MGDVYGEFVYGDRRAFSRRVRVGFLFGLVGREDEEEYRGRGVGGGVVLFI